MTLIQVLCLLAFGFAGFAVFKERSLAAIAVLFVSLILVVQSGVLR